MTRKQSSSKRSKHRKHRVKAAIWLCDDAGNVRESFSIGETIFVAGHGLTPTTAYEFVRLRESKRHKDEMLARYVTDRHGILNTTLLLPYFGLSDQGKKRYVTFDEANQ